MFMLFIWWFYIAQEGRSFSRMVMYQVSTDYLIMPFYSVCVLMRPWISSSLYSLISPVTDVDYSDFITIFTRSCIRFIRLLSTFYTSTVIISPLSDPLVHLWCVWTEKLQLERKAHLQLKCCIRLLAHITMCHPFGEWIIIYICSVPQYLHKSCDNVIPVGQSFTYFRPCPL